MYVGASRNVRKSSPMIINMRDTDRDTMDFVFGKRVYSVVGNLWRELGREDFTARNKNENREQRGFASETSLSRKMHLRIDRVRACTYLITCVYEF